MLDGVIVDEILLIFGIVIYGNGIESSYVNGEEDICVYWINFEDLEFGIEFYEIVLCDVWNVFICL